MLISIVEPHRYVCVTFVKFYENYVILSEDDKHLIQQIHIVVRILELVQNKNMINALSRESN